MSPLRLEHVLRKDLKDGQSKTGLARQTDGWKFAHQYRAGVKNKVVRIPRQSENFTSVSEEHGLGRAEQIFAVNANYQNDLMPRRKWPRGLNLVKKDGMKRKRFCKAAGSLKR
jgi:hypothetical protein